MKSYKIILFFLLFMTANFSGHAAESGISVDDIFMPENQDKTKTLDVVINSITKIKLEDIAAADYLEVFSILGVKVTKVNLKDVVAGECYIDLPKGLYILKAGKVAQKIVVK